MTIYQTLQKCAWRAKKDAMFLRRREAGDYRYGLEKSSEKYMDCNLPYPKTFPKVKASKKIINTLKKIYAENEKWSPGLAKYLAVRLTQLMQIAKEIYPRDRDTEILTMLSGLKPEEVIALLEGFSTNYAKTPPKPSTPVLQFNDRLEKRQVI